jgi:hypothetical protein
MTSASDHGGRRRLGWTGPSAIIAVLLLAGTVSLNYSGFCIAERRFVPDEEKIRAAVADVAVGDMVFWYGAGRDPDGRRSVLIDRPDTVDEFLAANPGCCRIVPVGRSMHSRAFPGRILGQVSHEVRIDYVRQIPDDRGILQADRARRHVYVTPCGTAVGDDFPPEQGAA